MTKNEAIQLVKSHNDMIDCFMRDVLPIALKMLGIKLMVNKETGETEIQAKDWFKAQSFVRNMKFYEKASKLQEIIRESGFDCRQDMQSNKLYIYG